MAPTHIPPLHIEDAQSFPLVQIFPRAHFAQEAPPQSTSDSLLFFTVSEQLAALHVPLRQTPERQFTHEPLMFSLQ
jgi:hypothetical protein